MSSRWLVYYLERHTLWFHTGHNVAGKRTRVKGFGGRGCTCPSAVVHTNLWAGAARDSNGRKKEGEREKEKERETSGTCGIFERTWTGSCITNVTDSDLSLLETRSTTALLEVRSRPRATSVRHLERRHNVTQNLYRSLPVSLSYS